MRRPGPRTIEAQAIGRLNAAGFRRKRHCTAFLVAPKVAVTAAHCVREAPGQLHLLLGYDRGRWNEHLVVDRIILPGGDVAFLCLAANAEARPLAAAPPKGPVTRAVVRGYGRPQTHVLSKRTCTRAGAGAVKALRLSCQASPGMSGGPITDPDSGRVLGVLSRASSTGEIFGEPMPPHEAACD